MADDVVKPEAVVPEAPTSGVEEETSLKIGPMIDESMEGAEEITTPSAETPSALAEPPAQPAIPSQAITPTLTPAETAPLASTQMQQRILALEQQLAQQRLREEEKADGETLNAWVINRQTELETEDGLTPERANLIANREAQAHYRGYQQTREHRGQLAEAQAKPIVAALVADYFKVPLTSLLHHTNPEAMIRAAQEAVAQGTLNTRITTLEKENAALRKAQVPAQQFDNNRGAGSATNRMAKIAFYVNGGELSEKEKRALFPD